MHGMCIRCGAVLEADEAAGVALRCVDLVKHVFCCDFHGHQCCFFQQPSSLFCVLAR